MRIIYILIITCSISILFIEHAYSAVEIEIIIEGVEEELRQNILSYLRINRQKDHPDLTPALLQKLHKHAPEEIRKALQPFGYYSPEIQKELMRKESAWVATYRVTLGSPVIIDSIHLSITGDGAEDRQFTNLVLEFPVKEGGILHHGLYEDSKRLLHDTALRSGYVKAQMITSTVEVYPGTNTAKVTIHFDTGQRYRFGNVEFIQDVFDPGFMKRFVPFKRGDPFSLSRLLDLQNILNDSDFFESVEINQHIEKADGLEIPIEVKLVPRKRHKYTLGLGYGTDTGLRGHLGWENRRVNNKGHRFRTELSPSEIRSSITAEYRMPLEKVRTDSIVYTGGWLTEDTKTSESKKLFGGVKYNHMRSGWKESVYLNYEEERFDVSEDSGRSTLLIPGISWTRVKAKNPINTRHGSRLYFDIRGAAQSVLSDISFIQFRTQVKFIRSLTSSGRILVRGEGGMSILSRFSELPASLRFFAGGDHSIRGYSYNSLGPEDALGNVVGGRNLLTGSVEYEHYLRDKWSAAVFYDGGNAFDSLSDPLKNGAGFGIRWRSPVGPIRVDLAFPLNESDKSWRLHLIIGPDL